MAKNLIISGGVAHDYETTSPILADILSDVAIKSDIAGIDVLEDETIQDYDMITLNCVYWTCAKNPDWYDQWHYNMPDIAKSNFLRFLNDGKGLLALHCATICFDDWPEYKKILGAWWNWDISSHAPFQTQLINIINTTHPITKEINDFYIDDELYTKPSITDSIDPLITAVWENETHPILWLREYGSARICYNALGHGPEAFENQSNILLLKRSALWVCDIDIKGADK